MTWTTQREAREKQRIDSEQHRKQRIKDAFDKNKADGKFQLNSAVIECNRLKETLRSDLEHHGETAATAGRFQIKRQNGQLRVVVRVDPSELPMHFQRLIIEVDKTALRDALKSGDVIEGAELQSTEHVRIRVK